MLSVLVKTSSLPSLRSTSHGTFEHVEEPALENHDSVTCGYPRVPP
ncbi:hypothetical protein ALC60_02552 [Trachymyrmex zeteki]|uniref:Uncharacterized protein n=1 Tax=Mycetomoellerius zeteki TaxID=64791 RepID=A0A151XDR1_9HYME|nr:hypothetical protein ALC60_02552 [Trachymyrmex zeteki]